MYGQVKWIVGLLVTAGCICGLQGEPARAGSRMEMSTTRTYVKEYKIVDGFAIPVTDTVVEGVFLEARTLSLGRTSRGRRDGSRSSGYVGKRATSPPAPVDDPPTEPHLSVAWPEIRTISLFGTLRVADAEAAQAGDDAPLILVVELNGEEITYRLLADAPARKLLAAAATGAARAIVVGKVHQEDDSPSLRVTAVIPVRQKAESSIGAESLPVEKKETPAAREVAPPAS